MKKTFTKKIKLSGIALLLSAACSQQSNAQIIYGTVGSSSLVSFNATTPGTIIGSIAITGVTAGQTIEGLDFRPNTGQLYALGYDKSLGMYQLYTINSTTGVATAINTATSIALGNGPIGFDFNPTVDRIRVVAANGGNFRLHPVTGLIVATDGTLAYSVGDANAGVSPKIAAGAYTNSYIGAGTTALYDYDNALNVIALQNPPNTGALNTIGSSGIITNVSTPLADMDIFYDNTTATNKAYLLANTSSSVATSNLYSIDLATGAATIINTVGGANPVSNIAVLIDRTVPALTGQLAYGLTGSNLISFDTQNPNFIRTISAITGVTAGQAIVGMDFRPATNSLYALGYNATSGDAQLYTINTATAVATAVNTTPTVLSLGTSNIGFDFNPTVDRIRVVSNNDNNYRLNPITGALAATDSVLKYSTGDSNFGANPNVGSIAYINSFSGATTTTLYNYDEILNVLTTQVPPNNGTLNTIGGSGIMVNASDATIDMDIYYDVTNSTNLAFLSANTATSTLDNLYSVNLTSGATTLIGKIGFGIPVKDIAIENSASTVGNIEFKKNEVTNFANVFPNPLNDLATIFVKNSNVAVINVINIYGKSIVIETSVQVISGNTVINWNTSNLAKGVYFVTVTDENSNQQVIKIVK